MSRPAAAATRIRLQQPTRSHGFALPVLALALGLALVAVAFPRLMAALYAAPAMPVLEKIDRGNSALTPGELLGARDALRLSLAWDNDGRTSVRLARITLALAAREFQAGGDPRRLVDETIKAARDGLAQAPSQARGWLLLAEATLARTSDPGAVVAMLLASITASPHSVRLAPSRAELGLRAWPWLDPSGREAVAGQIRLVADGSLVRLVGIARRAGDVAPVREALAQDKERLRSFDVLYLQSAR